MQDVSVTKAMCGAKRWTDHKLIVSKLNIRPTPGVLVVFLTEGDNGMDQTAK